MSAFKKLATAFAVSAVVASNGVMAQDVQADDISYDEGITADSYCSQTHFTTSVADEFFALIGCDAEMPDEEFWSNTPLVAEDFPIPTPEDFAKDDTLAKCLYGSLPGGAKIVDMPFGFVSTGDISLLEKDMKDIQRAIVYECLSLNMS